MLRWSGTIPCRLKGGHHRDVQIVVEAPGHLAEGYSDFLPARTQIEYRDRGQVLRISYEAMATPSRELVVYSESLTVEEPVRSLVLGRVTRALEFDGWKSVLES